MRKSILTVLFTLICTLGFAQVSFFVKGGLNLSSYIGENSDNAKFKPGARLGVGLEYQFSELMSLQPSLFFSQKGAKYSGSYSDNGASADADLKINQLYLELPVNLQFRFNLTDNTNLILATGPYLACGVGGKAKFDGNASWGDIELNGSDKVDTFGDDGLGYNRFDAGWSIGLGLEVRTSDSRTRYTARLLQNHGQRCTS